MKLKVALVSAFPEKAGVITGGVEGVAHCLVEGLKSVADLELHVVAPGSARTSGVELRDGVTIHWQAPSRIPAFLSYWSSFRHRIHRCLDGIAPDIAHFQGVSGWLLNYRKPCVLTIHGLYEKDILYRDEPFVRTRGAVIGAVERLGRRKSRNTILISPYVLDEIGDQLPGNNVHIENPVTAEFFELERAVTAPRLLFVGRICQRKNVHGLISLFARVHREVPGATLRVVGLPESAEYERQCKTQVAALGLEQAVSFPGNLPRKELLRELALASCLVLISFQETAPMIVEEAMAAGVPVMVTGVCGLPYMVQDGVTGYLVDPQDEAANAALLVRLLRDREANSAMGARCRETARARFHAESVARKTLELYRQVIETEAARP